MLRGVVILDSQFNEVDIIKLQKNSEPHGICVDPKRNWIFIGQPGRDSVAVYDINSKKLVKEYFISEKWSINKKDNHHVNDPFVYGDSLFISMFSFTGNWLNEVYDGGVLEIDLNSDKILGPVFNNMWMPHSVCRVNGKITLLNSMVGELWNGSYDLLTKTNGFARGLTYDGKYFYIGITEHRYPEKLLGISNNIGIDTGFFVFDPISKMSKLNPSSVICEVMNEDGRMARLDDLIKFSKKHNIKIASIADLIAYRLKTEKLMEIQGRVNCLIFHALYDFHGTCAGFGATPAVFSSFAYHSIGPGDIHGRVSFAPGRPFLLLFQTIDQRKNL